MKNKGFVCGKAIEVYGEATIKKCVQRGAVTMIDSI